MMTNLSMWVSIVFTLLLCNSVNAQTTCTSYSAPFSENFDATATGSFLNNTVPTCWSFKKSPGSAGYGFVNSSKAYVLNNGNFTGGLNMLISPAVTSLSDGTKRVRFSAKHSTSSSPSSIVVGTLSDPSNITTFTPISTIALGTSYSEYFVTFPAGTNVNFAFSHGDTNASQTINIDNIYVEYLPSCGEPSSPMSSAITSNTATISWTAPATAPANGYEVYFSTTNTAPTASTTLTATNSVSSSMVSATISSLNPVTTYYVWIRSVCSATEKSNWLSVPAFATTCPMYVPNYTQDFSTWLPSCWTAAADGNSQTGPLTFGTSNWFPDGFLNVGSTGAVKVNLFTSTTNTWLISPSMDLSNAGSYTISFNYGVTEFSNTNPIQMGSDDKVTVLISYNGGTTWTQIHEWAAANSPNNSLNTFTYTIPTTASSNNVKFAIHATDGPVDDAEDYDFFIDDFMVTNSGLLSTAEAKKEEVSVYPNPFGDTLTISDIKKVKSVLIVDISGKIIKKIANPTMNLHLADLMSGMYFVKLELINGGFETIKVIKK